MDFNYEVGRENEKKSIQKAQRKNKKPLDQVQNDSPFVERDHKRDNAENR